MLNPLAVLGAAETADDDAIKKAYLRQVREYPPERDPDRFQAIRAAFDAIKTRPDRLRYRLFGQDTPDVTGLAAVSYTHLDVYKRQFSNTLRYAAAGVIRCATRFS